MAIRTNEISRIRGQRKALDQHPVTVLHINHGQPSNPIGIADMPPAGQQAVMAGLGLGDADDGSIPLVGDEVAQTPQAMRWREVAEEVLASLRHAERRVSGCWPERIWVSGSGAAEPGLCEAVAAVCGTDTGPIGACPRISWPEGEAPEPHALWAGAVAAGIAARDTAQAAATPSKTRRVA